MLSEWGRSCNQGLPATPSFQLKNSLQRVSSQRRTLSDSIEHASGDSSRTFVSPGRIYTRPFSSHPSRLSQGSFVSLTPGVPSFLSEQA